MTTKEEQLIITKYDLLYEQRMTKVETSLEKLEKNLDTTFKGINETFREIKMDIRWILGLMFSFTTIILGVLAKGFHWL